MVMLLSWLGTDTIKCGAVKVVLLDQIILKWWSLSVTCDSDLRQVGVLPFPPLIKLIVTI